MRCSSGKICYDSETIAVEALIQNHARNNYTEGQGPVNIYECNLCSCYHFTSKASPHPILEEEKDRIKKLREAYNWEARFR